MNIYKFYIYIFNWIVIYLYIRQINNFFNYPRNYTQRTPFLIFDNLCIIYVSLYIFVFHDNVKYLMKISIIKNTFLNSKRNELIIIQFFRVVCEYIFVFVRVALFSGYRFDLVGNLFNMFSPKNFIQYKEKLIINCEKW